MHTFSNTMRFIREHQWHLTTEGSRIEQVLLSSGAASFAKAMWMREWEVYNALPRLRELRRLERMLGWPS